MEAPLASDAVVFGATVTFQRDDGRVQKYRIVGEDEANPTSGTISHSSPIARQMMTKTVGDVTGTGQHEIEILAIE